MGHILYVEDDPRDYQSYADSLKEDHFWEIERASGPVEAFERLSERNYDVVLIDRRMPDPETGEMRMVGDELLETLAARWPYLCLIVLTHFGDVEAAQTATRHGAYRYFVKGVEAAALDRACCKGMQWQVVRRLRHRLLSMSSIEEALDETKRAILRVLQPPGYCFAYLPLIRGAGLVVADYQAKTESAALADAMAGNCAFIEDFAIARRVVENRQFSLRRARREIPAEEGTLIDSPGSQLVVPVLGHDETHEAVGTTVTGLIWVESCEEKAFDRDDAEILSQLADYVGLALLLAKQKEELAASERRTEREELLSDFAHRVRNPLQVAQSTIDFLAARLNRECEVAGDDLRDELSKALDGIERAIQETSQLRRATRTREVAIQPTDLGALVEDVAIGFEARAKSNSTEIQTKVSAGVAKVMLNWSEMRYVLGCLLDNALEAIARQRAATAGDPEAGEILVSMAVEPSASKAVLLTVEDNGCAIPEQDLSKVFDRHYTTKTQDCVGEKEGLGLWGAKRFIDAVGGVIEAKNSPRGGALFRIILPACADDEPPRSVTLA